MKHIHFRFRCLIDMNDILRKKFPPLLESTPTCTTSYMKVFSPCLTCGENLEFATTNCFPEITSLKCLKRDPPDVYVLWGFALSV